MRSWLLLLASAFLSLGVLEIAIRAFDLFPEAREHVAAASPEEPAPADQQTGFKQFHPYFGWMIRPGAPPKPGYRHASRRNLFGFMSTLEDYRDVDEGDFVVGVFGGSVAAGVATWGGGELEAALVRERPELASAIRVLNFGSGAYKQPQQLMVLSEMILLGVPFDFVVNVDGLNEVALGRSDARAGHHPLLPSRPQMKALVDLAAGALSEVTIEASAEILRERRMAERFESAVAAPGWLSYSELARAVAGALSGRYRGRAAALESRLQSAVAQAPGAGLLATIPDGCLEERSGCPELIAEIWRRASLLMAAQAASIGAGYIHALQPSQYVPNSKELTAKERKRAYAPRSNWSFSVRRGYPLLQRHGAWLAARGIVFLDLTEAYAGIGDTIYTDVCCHTTARGYEVLGRRIGEAMAAALGRAGAGP